MLPWSEYNDGGGGCVQARCALHRSVQCGMDGEVIMFEGMLALCLAGGDDGVDAGGGMVQEEVTGGPLTTYADDRQVSRRQTDRRGDLVPCRQQPPYGSGR